MSNVTVSFHVSFAWWVKPFLIGVAITSYLTGLEPNYDRISNICIRGVKLSIN